MNRNGKDIQTNRGTVEEGSLPGFLGNERKSKEVSSVFAAILEGGLHQGNESQRTVQNHWLDPVEKLAKEPLAGRADIDDEIERSLNY